MTRVHTSKDAFATPDEPQTPERQIRREIDNLRAGSPLVYRDQLARRLEFLLQAIEEEGEVWGADSSESLRKMLQFLQSVPSFQYPTVTKTPSATFRAQWTKGENAHLALDFLADGQVRIVVFSPDPHHPQRVQRFSGVTGWENVLEIVGPFRVNRWTEDAGA